MEVIQLMTSSINFINGKAGSRGRVKKEPSHVVELDPSNFDKIVMDTDKDVLMEFMLHVSEIRSCTQYSFWIFHS